MASITPSVHLPLLAVPHEREGVGRELGAVLHELVALSFQAVAAGSRLTPVVQAAIEDHVVVRELTRRVSDVAERVRARMECLGKVDLVSQEVLLEVVRGLEKQLWMLRVRLGQRA